MLLSGTFDWIMCDGAGTVGKVIRWGGGTEFIATSSAGHCHRPSVAFAQVVDRQRAARGEGAQAMTSCDDCKERDEKLERIRQQVDRSVALTNHLLALVARVDESSRLVDRSSP